MNFYLILLLFFLMKNKISAIFLLFVHGIVSRLIFFIVGWICQNSSTRRLYFLSLLYKIRILFLIVLILTLIANFRVPPLISRFIEIYFIVCIFLMNRMLTWFIILLLLRSSFATLYLYIRLTYGNKSNSSKTYIRDRFLISRLILSYFLVFPFLLNF